MFARKARLAPVRDLGALGALASLPMHCGNRVPRRVKCAAAPPNHSLCCNSLAHTNTHTHSQHS